MALARVFRHVSVSAKLKPPCIGMGMISARFANVLHVSILVSAIFADFDCIGTGKGCLCIGICKTKINCNIIGIGKNPRSELVLTKVYRFNIRIEIAFSVIFLWGEGVKVGSSWAKLGNKNR